MKRKEKDMAQEKKVTITITEELAAKIERTTYLYRGRKEILRSILKDTNGVYNKEILSYYQELYDDSYREFQQMVEYVNTCILQEYVGRKFQWTLEYSTCSICVIFLDIPKAIPVEEGGTV